MSDLISKSKLLNTIATNVHYDSENPLAQYAKLLALVNDAPTVEQPQINATENMVEIVRCKDCKFYWKNNRDSDGVVCLATPKDDAFCSEGERKEDANIS